MPGKRILITGAAGFLGHELGAFQDFTHVLAVHAGQEPILHFFAAVALDQHGRGVRDRDRAH